MHECTLLMQVSEMIRIDANSSFFSIRNNERTQGAWNDVQNLVKLSDVDMHILNLYTADSIYALYISSHACS